MGFGNGGSRARGVYSHLRSTERSPEYEDGTARDNQPSAEEKGRPEYGIENGGSRAEGVYPHRHDRFPADGNKREYQGASIDRKDRPLGPPSITMPPMQIAKVADSSGREQGDRWSAEHHKPDGQYKEKRSQRDRKDDLQGLDDMVTDAEGHLIE